MINIEHGQSVGEVEQVVYLERALIFLLFLFSLRIRFFLHFALIFSLEKKSENKLDLILSL